MTPRRHQQGMKWIRASRRLAIYMRDGFACCWCGQSVAVHGVTLTLDHVKPTTRGGTHATCNLITACMSCNRQRRTRGVLAFARLVAAASPHGWLAERVCGHIRRQRRRRINMTAAREQLRAATLREILAKLNES